MKETKYYCNGCKKEFNADELWETRITSIRSSEYTVNEKWDLCKDCISSLKEYVENSK